MFLDHAQAAIRYGKLERLKEAADFREMRSNWSNLVDEIFDANDAMFPQFLETKHKVSLVNGQRHTKTKYQDCTSHCRPDKETTKYQHCNSNDDRQLRQQNLIHVKHKIWKAKSTWSGQF